MEECNREVSIMKITNPVYTIGHSTRTLDEFIATIEPYGVEIIIDIRTIPKSRHNPQFNIDSLADFLRKKQIGYVHMKGLGGLRHPIKDSVNTGWRNSSFRGFADYMQTEEFEHGLDELTEIMKKKRVAIMCAEAVPWRCHRSLVADALTMRGVQVIHIMGATAHHVHKLTPFAKVRGAEITYPAEDAEIAREKPPLKRSPAKHAAKTALKKD